MYSKNYEIISSNIGATQILLDDEFRLLCTYLIHSKEREDSNFHSCIRTAETYQLVNFLRFVGTSTMNDLKLK